MAPRTKKEVPTPTQIEWGEIPENQKWFYQDKPLEEVPPNLQGFVYIIRNLLNGKKYIGKKNFWGTKIRQVNKKKIKTKVLSDFTSYYGSNDALKADVATHGAEHFQREILVLCETKSEMSWWETKYQFHYNVIDSSTGIWYNSWVTCKITAKHLKPHHFNHILRLDL